MKTTLEIPDDLYQRAKVHAALENRRVKDIVSEGLRLVLGRAETSPPALMRRMTQASLTVSEDMPPIASREQMAELIDISEVWGVTPREAMRRVAQAAQAANSSRKRALAALSKVRDNPPYAPGRVQEMIDEANRLRKESWD